MFLYSGGGARGSFGNTKGNSLDALSDLLTAASVIPGIDTFVDLASIPVDLLRGDFLSAGLDALGVLPIVGEVADTAKLAKMADKVADAAKVARISPFKLTQTHKINLNTRQYNKLVDSIRKNGIIESIKYVEYNGKKYVVDGHHRLRAAKQLGLDNIPVQKVSLPYKGYKSIRDLIWFD